MKGSLSIQNVTLAYGKGDKRVLALDGISFEVEPNEFTVIVGPSGCGKSSLLYIAAGLTDATAGQILASGKPVREPGADRGMVFQSYTLFPWLTVRRNIEYGLRRKGMPQAERSRIVDYYLNEVGLPAQLGSANRDEQGVSARVVIGGGA